MEILVIKEVGGHEDLGGGTWYELFENMAKAEEYINTENEANQGEEIFFTVYQVYKELKVKHVTQVTKYKIEL